jgi:protein phosphatase
VISDQGFVRKSNQDAWSELIDERCVMVADGMGGHVAGEVASWELVHSLSTYLPQMFHSLSFSEIYPEDVLHRLYSYLLCVNERIYRMSRAESRFKGMGTTLSCLFFLDKWVFYAHVGDSRIYRLNSSGLQRISEDQVTTVERPPGSKKFVKVLSQAIGVRKKLTPVLGYTLYNPGEKFLLCTDGLTNAVSEKELACFLKKQTKLTDKGKALLNLAKDRGGVDNITVALVEVENERCS